MFTCVCFFCCCCCCCSGEERERERKGEREERDGDALLFVNSLLHYRAPIHRAKTLVEKQSVAQSPSPSASFRFTFAVTF